MNRPILKPKWIWRLLLRLLHVFEDFQLLAHVMCIQSRNVINVHLFTQNLKILTVVWLTKSMKRIYMFLYNYFQILTIKQQIAPHKQKGVGMCESTFTVGCVIIFCSNPHLLMYLKSKACYLFWVLHSFHAMFDEVFWPISDEFRNHCGSFPELSRGHFV